MGDPQPWRHPIPHGVWINALPEWDNPGAARRPILSETSIP